MDGCVRCHDACIPLGHYRNMAHRAHCPIEVDRGYPDCILPKPCQAGFVSAQLRFLKTKTCKIPNHNPTPSTHCMHT